MPIENIQIKFKQAEYHVFITSVFKTPWYSCFYCLIKYCLVFYYECNFLK